MNQAKKLQTIKRLVKSLFNVEPTDGQAEIIESILDPNVKRLWVSTTTRYGKSFNIGIAVTLLLANPKHPLKIALVAPTEAQTEIIMNYALKNVSSNPIFYEGLSNRSKSDKATQYSKERLAWLDGRELYTITASASSNSNDINKAGRSVMGQGADIVIIDEASLINDIIYSKIFRMLADNPKGSKLVVIGNPFNTNHFYRSSVDPTFKHIRIDYERAIAEGRLTRDYVEEARRTMTSEMFEILFGVKFLIGSTDGYITAGDFEDGTKFINNMTPEQRAERDRINQEAPIRVGVDVAYYGDDESVILIRRGYKILHTFRYRKLDTMALVATIIQLQKEHNFSWDYVHIDYIGIGVGVVDRLHELGYDVDGVIVSEAPRETELYFNVRAEIWGRAKNAIREGLAIESQELKDQLLAPKYEYRYKTNGVVRKLESKETMKKRGIGSPDIADALGLSYYEPKGYAFGRISYL